MAKKATIKPNIKRGENKKLTPKKHILETDISIGGFGMSERVLFAKNMSVMIKSGLTIVEALSISAESMSDKARKIIENIKKSIEGGQSFSDGLRMYPKIFPQVFINAVYAGELSGSLEDNLEHVALQLRKERELVQKIKGAMLYPIVILIATFVLGMAISFFILPQITPLFEGLNMKLPFTTKGLIWFANLMKNKGLIISATAIASFLALAWLSRRKFSQPVTHKILLLLPVVSKIVKSSNEAKFCRTLGTLLKSGLTIDEAIKITRDSLDNYYYKKAASDIANRLSSGTVLSGLLYRHKKYFPKLLIGMIRVGEESGRLEDSLFYLANYYEEEVDNSTKTLSTAIEPILLIFIGLIVGFLALSIVTPIYNITSNISG